MSHPTQPQPNTQATLPNDDDDYKFSPIQQRPPTDSNTNGASSDDNKDSDLIEGGIPANNWVLQELNNTHSELAKYLKEDKGGLFSFKKGSPDGILGVLKASRVGKRLSVKYAHPGDWFNKLALLATTKPVTLITEGLYQVWVYHGSSPVRHTGVRFQSQTTGQTFLFDVQSFDCDLSYTPLFREEPSTPYQYVPIGYGNQPGQVYLSRGLLSLPASIPSQHYSLLGNNCRDGLLCTILLCQFWNASLGIPQCINVDVIADFIAQVFTEDASILGTIGLKVNPTNEERREAMHNVLSGLAKCSHYDATINELRNQGVLGPEGQSSILVVSEATPQPEHQPVPPPSSSSKSKCFLF